MQFDSKKCVSCVYFVAVSHVIVYSLSIPTNSSICGVDIGSCTKNKCNFQTPCFSDLKRPSIHAFLCHPLIKKKKSLEAHTSSGVSLHYRIINSKYTKKENLKCNLYNFSFFSNHCLLVNCIAFYSMRVLYFF